MLDIRKSVVLSALAVAPLSLAASAPGPFGDWKTADGSIVRTFPCAQNLCIKIVTITPTAPGTVDFHNPDASLRSRSLCNLEIGSGFAIHGSSEASGGRLYDPESGKTYQGNLNLDGDILKLRGYIGISLFGRTETWHRATSVKACG